MPSQFANRGVVPRADVARDVFIPFVLARALVGGALAVTRAVVDQFGFDLAPATVEGGLLAWDASWYRDIAAGGYDAVPIEGLRFFPLVPMLARAFALVPGVDAGLGLILVSNLSALALGFALYALAWRERGDEMFARRAVWLAYLLPPAFVLVMGYSEATLMLLAVLVLLGTRSQRWWLAAGAGFLAGLARPVGLLLAVPALVEALQHRHALARREVAGRIAAVVAPAVGLYAYLAWASDRGEGLLYPVRVQEDPERRGSWRFPLTNIFDAARDAGTDHLSIAMHVVTALVIVVLVVVLFRNWPASYAWYGAAVAVVALGASNLDSLERYSLSTIPFLMAAADLTGGEARERIVFTLCGAGLVAASVLAFAGVLVP